MTPKRFSMRNGIEVREFDPSDRPVVMRATWHNYNEITIKADGSNFADYMKNVCELGPPDEVLFLKEFKGKKPAVVPSPTPAPVAPEKTSPLSNAVKNRKRI